MFTAVIGAAGRIAPYAAKARPVVVPVLKQVATQAGRTAAASAVAGVIVATITKGGKPDQLPKTEPEESRESASKVGAKTAKFVTPVIHVARAAARKVRTAGRIIIWLSKAALRTIREDWLIITLLAATPIFTAIHPWVGLLYAIGVLAYVLILLAKAINPLRVAVKDAVKDVRQSVREAAEMERRVKEATEKAMNLDTTPEEKTTAPPQEPAPSKKTSRRAQKRVADMTRQEVDLAFDDITLSDLRSVPGKVGRQIARTHLVKDKDWDMVTAEVDRGLRRVGIVDRQAIQVMTGFNMERKTMEAERRGDEAFEEGMRRGEETARQMDAEEEARRRAAEAEENDN